ncbi:MAG: HlyD family secretion protein [Rhodomicrobium sp.]
MVHRAGSWCVAVAALLITAGCTNPGGTVFQGWVEANQIFVAPDETGRVQEQPVREGDVVTAGQELFTVDDDLQQADLRQNQATVTNAQIAFDRAEKLLKTGSGTQMAFDNAQAALREARARLDTSQTRLSRRKVLSPATGTVEQVYFRTSEIVPAGRPVLSMLPPANLKVRFFVPETVLPKLSYGQRIEIHCDSCPSSSEGAISFISRSAEYTPPVIYSLEERSKLVFLIEALPDHPESLRVGQPLSVAVPGLLGANR